jgi:hypothetical protein
MKTLTKTLSAFGAALVLSATAASAEIVCNDDGDCWHTKRHDYGPELKLHVHPNNWKWGNHEHAKYRFREHEGHGYWRGGVWIGL